MDGRSREDCACHEFHKLRTEHLYYSGPNSRPLPDAQQFSSKPSTWESLLQSTECIHRHRYRARHHHGLRNKRGTTKSYCSSIHPPNTLDAILFTESIDQENFPGPFRVLSKLGYIGSSSNGSFLVRVLTMICLALIPFDSAVGHDLDKPMCDQMPFVCSKNTADRTMLRHPRKILPECFLLGA